MTVTWKSAKDVIYIATIAIGVVFYFRDEAKEEATIETTQYYIQRDIKEINKKLDKYEVYWYTQGEITWRIIDFLDNQPGAGTETEGD